MRAEREHGVIGCAIGPFRGRVQATFERALHVRAGDAVITLGGPGLAPHPYAILWPRWSELVAAPGAPAELAAGRLTVGSRSAPLGPMHTYTPRRAAPRWAGATALAGAITLTRAAAGRLGRRGGLHRWLVQGQAAEDPWSEALLAAAGPGLAAAAGAVHERDWRALATAAARLAGLGPGLTPSGDDFLAGLLSAIRYHGAPVGRPVPQAALDAVATRAAAATTSFAGFLIRCAARGWVSRPAERWLAAVHAGSPTATARTAAVAELGHSSGIDVLAGLVCGLEAAEGWRS